MSINVMILGESGTGKSASLRNMDPANTMLIQSVKKPLPFKSKDWARFDSEACKTGNIFLSDDAKKICTLMERTRRKSIVLDDFQYVLANEFMRRSGERGYEKFTDIGRNAWDILNKAAALPDDVCVYILAHSQSDDDGKIKMKTIGKMLDEKLTPEGLFSIVLRTQVRDGAYLFSTKNSGQDTVKSPMGMFSQEFIDNDLNEVDRAIRDYYEISTAA